MLEQQVLDFIPIKLEWLCIMVASMLPLVEIHGAIPFGLSQSIWGENVLPLWQVCCFSLLGACIMATIILAILFLFTKIISKNKRFLKIYTKFNLWLESKFFRYNTSNANNKTLKQKKWWTLVLFNAVPLPFSGVWTSGLLAMFLNLSFPLALSALLVGNIITVLVIALCCTIFSDFVDLLLVVFIIITILFIIYQLLKLCINKMSTKQHTNSL